MEWRARGAWSDWKRIQFPEGFTFPIGTNAITEITLVANGSLRTSLTNTTPLVSLPYEVSLEPDESSVSYGLSPSNSLLIAWSNACVERSATNRVDATIELFTSGDMLVTCQPLTTNHQPPTTTFIPASLPEGWIGEGQNGAWASMAFPSNATDIAEDGYDSWLTDYVGINEQNGRYKASITVMSRPMSGGPCYLECGPYKVVVKEPGTYSFPLEVFEHYTARTYPEAVPIAVDYDGGYREDDADTTSSSAAPRRAASLQSFSTMIDVCMIPQVHLSPSSVNLDDAAGTVIRIWCNMKDRVVSHFSHSGHTRIVFSSPSVAELVSAAVRDLVVFILRQEGHEVTAELPILAPDDPHHCPYCFDVLDCPHEGHCSFGECGCHILTNGLYRCSARE